MQALREGKCLVKVTQFLYPTGQRRETTTKLAIEAKPFYDAMIAAGCSFEAEILNTAQVSVTISNGEKDIAIRLCENGPTVQRGMLDMLIGEPWK